MYLFFTYLLNLLSEEVVTVFFFLQVETMHDFEAANSDELELNRGDVVLVVPTASIEDQVRIAGDTLMGNSILEGKNEPHFNSSSGW